MALTFPQIPTWLVADKPTWAQQSAQTHDLFSQGYQSARNEQSQKNLMQFKLDKQREEQERLRDKFTPISAALQGAKTPEESWSIVSQNPSWMADPETAPGVANYLKTQSDVAKAELDTLAGKNAIADLGEFSKRASNLTAEDRSILQQVPGAGNGRISPDQWSMLAKLESKYRTKATEGLDVSQVTVGQDGQINTIYKDPNETRTQSTFGKLLADRERAKAAGKEDQVALYDAEIKSRGAKDGFQVQYDDQGRVIINYGPQVAGGFKPTVATQSQSQRKLQKYEASSELLNGLEKSISPEYMGARGVIGEMVLDRGLSQIYPELANKERIDFRTGLVAAREGLMREISDDTRFSNADREEIAKALPSSGVFTSAVDAKQRIQTVRKILKQRGKIYSNTIGATPPLWTMEPEEIKALFQDKKITEEQAVDALTRFH